MKITIYELLGLIKDGKVPKKIKYCGCIYEWEEDWYLTKEKNCKVCLGGKKEDINQLYNAFNDNVEIIEEEKEIKTLNQTRTLTNGSKNELVLFYYCNDLEKKLLETIEVVNELRKEK